MTLSFPSGNTKPTSWSIPAPATNDGNDVTKSGHEEESFSSIKNPLLGAHDYPNQKKTWGKIVFTLLALLAVTCLVLTSSRVSLEHSELHGKVKTYGSDTVESDKGVVVSDDPRCSEVGVSMLRLGGHAVDAAIATALCLGVVSPTESGIGGGAFMVVRSASTSKAFAFDMRETAPVAASENMYENNLDAQVDGPLSIAVPGELAGLYEAWKFYGRLPWETLFQPAIRYAIDGFKVFPYLANDIKEFQDKIKADPGLREVFAPNGKLLEIDETCYNKQLGSTLTRVAKKGLTIFYSGLIGKKLANDVRKKGGILTITDLRNYQVKRTDVVEADVMGYKILGMPLPSSGTVGLVMVANILKNYGRSNAAFEGTLGVHRLTEAMKHMLAIRTNLGDPDFDHVSEYVFNMTSSPSFAKEIWLKIFDNTTFPASYYHSRGTQLRDHGTSHLGVVDAERNAVALTTSVNDQFGSKFLSPSTGIVLNNQMRDFSLPPSTANLIVPGKRPLSSMTPLIILKDGQLAGVIGGSGGLNIIAAVTQVFLKHLVLGMDPRAAVHSPRVYPKLNLTNLDYEDLTAIVGEHIELSEEKKLCLELRGHHLTVVGFPASCHLIVQSLKNEIDLGRKKGRKTVGDTHFGMLTAVSDLRKDGKPAGM